MRLTAVLLLGVGSLAVLSTGCSDLTRPKQITIEAEPIALPKAPPPVAAVTPPPAMAQGAAVPPGAPKGTG